MMDVIQQDPPATCRAAIYDHPGTISTKIITQPIPTPGPGEVLIRLTHSGVCASDLGIMTNTWLSLPSPTQPGQIGGHEGVGTIVSHGPSISSSFLSSNPHLAGGKRVGIKWLSDICDLCPPCLAGHDAICFNQKVSGYGTPGTFQEYVVSSAKYVTPIPDGLESQDAAPMLCAGVTVYSALRKCGAIPGQWVALLGAGGGLGHLATQIAAKAMGFRVLGVDSASKEQFVRDAGAEVFIDHTVGNKEVERRVLNATDGLGVHAVLVLTAANPAYAMALSLLRFGGTLVAVGIPQGNMVPIAGALPQILVAKELRIIGVAVGNRKEAIEVLDLAARGIIKCHNRIESINNLTKVFEEMKRGELTGRVVLDLTI